VLELRLELASVWALVLLSELVLPLGSQLVLASALASGLLLPGAHSKNRRSPSTSRRSSSSKRLDRRWCRQL